MKGFDLTLEEGEVVSVIGGSGNGKTTLLRSVNFLERPDDGRLILDGEVLFDGQEKPDSERILREKRLQFGLVFQSFHLFPQYNVLQNVTLAPMLSIKEDYRREKDRLSLEVKRGTLTSRERKIALSQFKKERKEQILVDGERLLEQTGLSDKRNAYPCELSGGQQQRVAIARALALKPKILCFDEPTSALDPELTGEVLNVIRDLKKEGATMLIVTHEMAFARQVSDKVVFMSDGRAEETGTPEEIFDRPQSEKLKNFLSNIQNREEEQRE